MWLTSVSGPANQSTEDAETLNLLWKPNLEIYGLQVMMMMVMMMMMMMVMTMNETLNPEKPNLGIYGLQVMKDADGEYDHQDAGL